MLWVSDFTFAKTIFHKILSQGALLVCLFVSLNMLWSQQTIALSNGLKAHGMQRPNASHIAMSLQLESKAENIDDLILEDLWLCHEEKNSLHEGFAFFVPLEQPKGYLWFFGKDELGNALEAQRRNLLQMQMDSTDLNQCKTTLQVNFAKKNWYMKGFWLLHGLENGKEKSINTNFIAEKIARISLEKYYDFVNTRIIPKNLQLVFCGDLPSDWQAKMEQALGDLSSAPTLVAFRELFQKKRSDYSKKWANSLPSLTAQTHKQWQQEASNLAFSDFERKHFQSLSKMWLKEAFSKPNKLLKTGTFWVQEETESDNQVLFAFDLEDGINEYAVHIFSAILAQKQWTEEIISAEAVLSRDKNKSIVWVRLLLDQDYPVSRQEKFAGEFLKLLFQSTPSDASIKAAQSFCKNKLWLNALQSFGVATSLGAWNLKYPLSARWADYLRIFDPIHEEDIVYLLEQMQQAKYVSFYWQNRL
jgi:hypothetical protein